MGTDAAAPVSVENKILETIRVFEVEQFDQSSPLRPPKHAELEASASAIQIAPVVPGGFRNQDRKRLAFRTQRAT